MKHLLALTFASFILSATSLEIDETDDSTIEYFLSELFNLEEPEKYELVKAEVKQHADELLEGLFSLVGEGFEFERDMKEKFNKEFEMEKLQKAIENIFGVGSEIVSQLQKNSAEVKQNILDLIDSFVGGSGRTKRSSDKSEREIEILNEIFDDSKDTRDSLQSKKDASGKKQEKKKTKRKVDIPFPDDSDGSLDIEHDDSHKVDDIKLSRDDTGDKLEIKDVDSNKEDNNKIPHDDKEDKDDHDDEDESKSDHVSDEKGDDSPSHTFDRLEEKIANFTDLGLVAAEDLIQLKENKILAVVNYTKEELEKNKKRSRKLRKDTIDFLKTYVHDLVNIFKTFGIRDLIP